MVLGSSSSCKVLIYDIRLPALRSRGRTWKLEAPRLDRIAIAHGFYDRGALVVMEKNSDHGVIV